MTKDKSILIKNIYYMLSYAFRVLKQKNYEKVSSEQFEKIQDLFAEILSKGVAQQLKQGLHRDYITTHDSLPIMRSKLDMSETIKNKIQRKQLLGCEFDELSIDNLFNQILKTTIYYLIRDNGVGPERKDLLKKIIIYFDDVSLLNPSHIQWKRLNYSRNNRSYELLMNICYFVPDGMLQTTEDGEYKLQAFSDEHMEKLYERFILEYYIQHHTYLSEARAAQVKWNLTGENDESMIRFLPTMKTDTFLRYKDKVLIIDAKYYTNTMKVHYDTHSLDSANLYQIFAYVKNQDTDNTGNVAGLLLYAKTEEEITPNFTFNIDGNQISAKTLDLNTDFAAIRNQLDRIANEYFGIEG